MWEHTTAMMHHAGVPEVFWIYAVTAAIHCLNRTPSRGSLIPNKTPIEIWSGKQPSDTFESLVVMLGFMFQKPIEQNWE